MNSDATSEQLKVPPYTEEVDRYIEAHRIQVTKVGSWPCGCCSEVNEISVVSIINLETGHIVHWHDPVICWNDEETQEQIVYIHAEYGMHGMKVVGYEGHNWW